MYGWFRTSDGNPPVDQDNRRDYVVVKRLRSLAKRMSARNLDVLALVPGPNLFYLTGLSFYTSERPIVAFFPQSGEPVVVLPVLESAKAGRSAIEMEVFSYEDETGYEDAFRGACSRFSGCAVGVEALQMRVLELRLLERHGGGSEFLPSEGMLAELRMRKDEQEIEQMRRAIAASEAALKAALTHVGPGMTERDLASRLKIEMLLAGGEGLAFEPITAAGPNSASPHAVPSDRAIQPGETIVIDFGTSVGGYLADITRTFSVGALSPELAEVYDAVASANEAGFAAVGPGIPIRDVDRAARTVIERAGYGEHFTHRTGHGLGLDVHERPYIGAGNERLLEPGMVFTVEPGIYLPGRGGVRIEDDVLVTSSGAERLTTFPREHMALGG